MKLKFNFPFVLYNLLFLAGIICMLLFYLFDIFYLKIVFGVIGNLIFFYELRNKIDKGTLFLYIILLILIIATLSKSLIFSTIEGIGNIPILIAHIGYGISIYKNRLALFVPLFLFIITSLYISYNLSIGVDPNEIFYTRSRNHISILLIYLACFLYIYIIRNEMKIWIWPSFVTSVLSFFAIGRAGILSALILLAGTLLFKLVFKLNSINKIMTVILLLGIAIIVIYVNLDEIFYFVLSDLRLDEIRYSEDVRLLISQSYIASVDNLKNFLFGFPYEQQTSFYGGYTLHNSYLNAHFRYGAYSFLILLLVIIALFKGTKELNMYVMLLIVICVRGITDTIFIGENFDFVFFTLLALILSKKTNTTTINSTRFLSRGRSII